MFYMPPNTKFISVHITSSISDVCLQEVVGMAKNNDTTNHNDVRFHICNFISWNKCKAAKSRTKTTASHTHLFMADPCLNSLEYHLKMGQVPAECTKHRTMIPKGCWVHDKRENNQLWHNHLVEQKDSTIWSCTAYITAILQQLSVEPGYVSQGRTYLFFGTCFGSLHFSVAVDKNVLRLESVTSAVTQITW